MTAGRLTKKGRKTVSYYAVMSYSGKDNKRVEKWINLKLDADEANFEKAKKLLLELKYHYDPNDILKTNRLLLKFGLDPLETDEAKTLAKAKKLEHKTDEEASKEPVSEFAVAIQKNGLIPFGNYMKAWLEHVKPEIQPTTYSGYHENIYKVIAPYFDSKKAYLQTISPEDLEAFYRWYGQNHKATTVIRQHANIRKALQYAYKKGIVLTNVADRADKPKKQPFLAHFYNQEQMAALLEKVKGTQLEFGVMMACYYGLRREEVVGLKWDAIDFQYGTITIKSTVTECIVDGKRGDIARDTTKTKKSFRTLPMVPAVEKELLAIKKSQGEMRALLGNTYCQDYLEYIYLWPDGRRVKSDWVTTAFHRFLKNNGLPMARFHDLRHSCATLARHEGVPMEDIQKWLGHSTITTTEGIYAHYDDTQSIETAKKISGAIDEGLKEDKAKVMK